ncbi:hypothetical protein [Asticcacaulis biprosthecium]|uniref:hypothetical protein n=1 Tax=Asticcacaulis biprosthecium TaxID=76891 RepID=UPI0005904FBC|nr:hypothetical protein [Asticcacaulis biprosthecium]
MFLRVIVLIVSLSLSLSLSLEQSAAGAEPVTATINQQQKACFKEAMWPLENKSGYKNGSVRVRQQMRNSPGPEIREMRLVCFALSKKEAADRAKAAERCQRLVNEKRRRNTTAARLHAERAWHYCETLQQPYR